MKRFVKLNIKLSVVFILVISVLFLASGSSLYFEFSTIFRQQIMDDLDQVMAQNKINMDHMVDSIDQATMLLYTDRTIIDILNRNSTDFVKNFQNKEVINNQLIKYIYVPLSSTLTSYGITFFVSDNMPFAKNLTPSSISVSGLFSSDKVAKEPWYRHTLELDGSLYWFKDPEDQDHFYVTRLIKNPRPGDMNEAEDSVIEKSGVVVINFDIDQVRHQIESSKLTPSTKIMLLDGNGQLLYSQDKQMTESMFSRIYNQRHNTMKNNHYGLIHYENQEYIYNMHGIKNDWQLVALIPMSDISKRMGKVKTIIWTTTVIAILMGIAISLFISYNISRPIRKLALTMGGIQNPQNMQVVVKPPTNDEVGILYMSFNKMMKRINELMTDVYNSGVKEKGAELKALQAQINPHFLYNTLDSVNWMALGSGQDEIATTISSLANILRYSIKDPDQFIPVSEEVEQVEHYIGIQLLCYDHKFHVQIEIDPQVGDCRMPKLILQPLVENAIQHGIEPSKKQGYVHISGSLKEGKVILTVKNSGDQVDHDALNAYLRGGDRILPRESGGYGIRNVDQRLKLLFGNEFGLHYEANEAGGVAAVVMLPRQGNAKLT